MDPSHLLSVSFTPVALISACGLITLALYNRLGAILARIRAFHLQKIELLEDLPEHDDGEAQMLLDLLDSQIAKVTVKAKAIQKGLYCLLSAVLAFLLCSLFAAAAVLHERVGVLAIVMHVLGLSLFLVGIVWAMGELTHSITPLEEESSYLETLTTHRLANSQSRRRLRMAKSA
jgi:hypothetical protein